MYVFLVKKRRFFRIFVAINILRKLHWNFCANKTIFKVCRDRSMILNISSFAQKFELTEHKISMVPIMGSMSLLWKCRNKFNSLNKRLNYS